MSVTRLVSRVFLRAGLCALLAVSATTVCVEAAASEASDSDARATFVSMVGKLEKSVASAKKHAFATEGELKKLAKRAETASWRVAAARERFDQYQKAIANTKESAKRDELKGKLANELKLLKTDAEKLSQMMDRSKELRSKGSALADELRVLKDDVAIEADRCDEGDITRKKALRLIADADWAVEKLDEVNAELQTSLEAPAGETLGKTQVQ